MRVKMMAPANTAVETAILRAVEEEGEERVSLSLSVG